MRAGSGRDARPPDVALVEGDLDDADALSRGIEGVDAVIHAAALTRKLQESRERLFRVNEGGTSSVLDACERASAPPRFVLVSTLSAVGPSVGGAPIDEQHPCRPMTDYGASKLAAEQVTLARSERLPVVVVRLPGIYGERDPNLLRLFRLVSRGVRPAGDRHVAFVHARDAAEALLLAASSARAPGETYHANGEDLTVGDVGIGIAEALGVKTVPLPIPAGLVFAAAAFSEGLARVRRRQATLDWQKARDLTATWRVSSVKLRRSLGWTPTHTFAGSMTALLADYRARGLLR